MTSADEPRISVVIATRDRPEELLRCVASVLSSHHDSFEVVIVDQSEPASPVPRDRRLVQIPTESRGKSAALNIGMAATHGDLVAFTDDDCTVACDWLDGIEELFAQHPEVAMAFGEVRSAPHDASQVFVPQVEIEKFRIVRDARLGHIRGGGGGNMAARRSVFDAIGGYDERIGPGSQFHACEEYDIYYRVLATGWAVAFAPEFTTTHWGERSYADGSGQLIKRWYAYGEGAVIGKHLRMGDRRMAGVAARDHRPGLAGLRRKPPRPPPHRPRPVRLQGARSRGR